MPDYSHTCFSGGRVTLQSMFSQAAFWTRIGGLDFQNSGSGHSGTGPTNNWNILQSVEDKAIRLFNAFQS
jgi:hypothetical protein